MSQRTITIKDIEPVAPFSRGSTEIFLTGHWSPRKPVYVEKTSPCREACPIGNDISRAFAYAARGDFDEALRIFRQDNPLPGVCGRVCYHPCEGECNRKGFDKAVNIRGFERFLSDHGKVEAERVAAARKERVAVVGSGPAGLSAAYHLARLGYGVTVFEALPEPGGMLMYGIPEYRLPKAPLAREIGYIRQLGVEIKTNFRVGKDAGLKEIKESHDAVFIAAGAHKGMRLGVEGEDLPGVTEGVSFLRDVNSGGMPAVGKRVAVIGGGNTAIDCARAAKRLGGEEVVIVYRRTRAEMPALEEDVASVEKEGIGVEFLAAPTRIIPENGRLAAIECARMELGAPDGSGRPAPVPVRGSEFILPVDTVLAAIGQAPDSDFAHDLGLEVDGRGTILISPDTAATNVEGIFAGGDSSGARAFVADAIGSGKRGALAIHCYFNGMNMEKELASHRIGSRRSFSFRSVTDPAGYGIDLKAVVGPEGVNTLCFPYAGRNDNPEMFMEKEAAGTFREMTGDLRPDQMEKEVNRCFKCGTCTECDLCFLLCPDISITKSRSGGYTVRTDFCKGCGMCATTCPRHVIDMREGASAHGAREGEAHTALPGDQQEALPSGGRPTVGALSAQAPTTDMREGASAHGAREGATQAPIAGPVAAGGGR